eukprot:4657666-Prymnesium_polylepis.1
MRAARISGASIQRNHEIVTLPERNHKIVKDRHRNHLGHEKVNKLTALFHNLRLLKRMKEPNYSGSQPHCLRWAADDEHSGVTKFKLGGAAQASALWLKPP